jgi:lipopolysaccharide exporter
LPPPEAESVGRRLASNAALLFIAGLISQVFTFGGLLVIARLYAPEQVGSFAVVVAIGAIITTVASGRFDLAIVIEHVEERAVIYAKLVAALTVAGSVVALAGSAATMLFVSTAMSASLSAVLLFLPALVFTGGLKMASVGSVTRSRQYSLLALHQVVIAAGTLAGQTAFAFVLPTDLGLAAGYLIGQVAGLFVLRSALRALVRPTRLEGGRHGVWQAVVDARTFPLHAVPYSFVQQLYYQLPQLMIATFYGLNLSGQYSTAERITYGPIALLPAAVSQVLFGEMARTPQDKLWGRRIAIVTASSGIVMSIFVAAVLSAGPDLAVWLLGDRWLAAGELAQQVAVASLLTALVNTYDRIFDVFGRQRLRLFVFIFNTVILAGVLSIFGVAGVALPTFVLVMVVVKVAAELLCAGCAFKASGFPMTHLVYAMVGTAASTAVWWMAFQSIDLPALVRALAQWLA